jgi:hypothetical protein
MDPVVLAVGARVATRTAESFTRVATSAIVLESARHVIWASWRGLLAQRAPIIGGADGGDGTDRARHSEVRRRLRSGWLPRVDGRVWACAGSLEGCAVCGQPIHPTEIAYQPRAADGLSAHVRCFRLWLIESQVALRLSTPFEADGHPGPAADDGDVSPPARRPGH